MARPKEIIDAGLAEQAAQHLRRFKGHKIYLRLLVISKAAQHPITKLAQFFEVSRGSLARWIRRFRQGGVAGLEDRPKGHAPSKLTPAQRAQIAEWIAQGIDAEGRPVHWTLEKLRRVIGQEFGVSITLMPLWRHVRQMGFRQKVPRPRHPQADPQVQEAFKKNG